MSGGERRPRVLMALTFFRRGGSAQACIVTGASRGIGREAACMGEGEGVLLVARGEAALIEAAEICAGSRSTSRSTSRPRMRDAAWSVDGGSVQTVV